MSVTRVDGVSVYTSDPQSACPPLCQIFGCFCYNPACFTVSPHMRKVQRTTQTVLGTLHIMVGLLNIGLGAILSVRSSPYPFWLGGMFILFGIVSFLSERYPSPCLVFLNVFLNLSGVCFALAAIVLYSIDMVVISFWWMCDEDYSYMTPSPDEEPLMEKCLESKALVLMLVRSVLAVLIVLSVVELCIVITSAVLGIKTLKSSETENKSPDDQNTTQNC